MSRLPRASVILPRLLGGVLVVWVAVTLTFVSMQLMPGDMVDVIIGGPGGNNSPEARQAVIDQYGLDQSVAVQYLHYLASMFSGDFGTSHVFHQDVTSLLLDRIGPTLMLGAAALVLAWVLAVGLVMLTAGRGRIASSIGSGLEIFAVSTPQLWLGMVLLLVFSFQLGWFPIAGGSGIGSLVLPTVAMAVPLAGYLGQVSREATEHALEQPFVLTARARGMSDLGVRFRHVLRHAALPGVTLSGFAVGWLFSGAVVVESLFGRPGLGSTLLAGVQGRDAALTGAIVVVSAVLYVVANLVVDLLYPLIDPRIRVR
ncbi:ABC transporter permease [Nocardioides sp. W7]|uniref:ABC transporter permease n=1 Tax=Nocardioides sp. W7 TaxID=2931390 RepID=UPI001FD25F1D|nr:ABC transporter permease [Nocardioides sp. W7]